MAMAIGHRAGWPEFVVAAKSWANPSLASAIKFNSTHSVNTMQIKQQVTINASADKVWDILGPQYGQVSDWISAVHVSKERKSVGAPRHAPVSGRVCETDLGPFKETVTRYDAGNRSLAYTAQGDKMPFFVKQMSNAWQITPLDDHNAKVEMCLEVSILPVFNLVMGPMMRMQMGGILKNAVEELKYYAETGMPHPRKLEAQRNYELKAA